MGGLREDKTSSKGWNLRSTQQSVCRTSNQAPVVQEQIVISYPADKSLSKGQNSSTHIISVVRFKVGYWQYHLAASYPTEKVIHIKVGHITFLSHNNPLYKTVQKETWLFDQQFSWATETYLEKTLKCKN